MLCSPKVYLCVRCGATAVNKLMHLRNNGGTPTPALRYNLKAYAKGLAPKGFPGWPFSREQLKYNVVVKDIRSQVNHIWETLEPDRRRQEDLSDSTSCESDGSYPDTVVSGSSSHQ